MNKVTTVQRLDTLQEFIFRLEIDMLNYFDLSDTKKDVIRDRITFLMNYIDRMKEELDDETF